MFDQEPQDIFAGTDKAPAKPAQPSNVERASIAPPPKLVPAVAPSAAPAMTASAVSMDSSPRSHFLRNIAIVAVALVFVAGGAYLAYALMIKPIMNASVAPVIPVTPTATVPLTSPLPGGTEGGVAVPPVEDPGLETPPSTPTDSVPNPALLDADGDGLTDAEEITASTSSTNPDTDGDGLGDREEVKVYGTDPLRTDTDGDSFLDGAEVAGGYNPNGPGKLLQIPTTP